MRSLSILSVARFDTYGEVNIGFDLPIKEHKMAVYILTSRKLIFSVVPSPMKNLEQEVKQ